ncbi:tetratricopeptide repeat protein [Fusobacterium canifelinum]|uniref:Tetratricopeptide repeat protein n=1 Tax=Fusobacterium canifelinum TaxID=285729 RepID=A0A3P1V3G9_9FUSO|nr:tetratricopeptide repeat protein [Fusobacterium canifelinum]RRD28749.1 tetratricopeptide repeat protein [Fusobacterium canifelinum]
MKNNLIDLLNILHKENKHQEIVDKIEALTDKEKTPEIIGVLARAYNNVENYEKALELLKSIENTEKNTHVWNYHIGYAYFYLEDYLEAEKNFLKAIELKSDDEDSHLFLSWIYEELSNEENEDYEKAMEYINKSLKYLDIYSKLAPEEDIKDELIISEERIGWLYDKLKNYTEAEKHLRKAIDLGDNDEWVYSQLGYNLRCQDRYEEAIENYKKALELGREDSWIYSEIAWTYFLSEQSSEALEYMNKAKELSPVEVDPSLVSRTSSILVALGKHTEAIKILEEIMSKEEYKDNIGILSDLAYVYDELDDYQNGLIYLKRANELGRNDFWINKELSFAYYYLEEYEKAYEYLVILKDMGEEDIKLDLMFAYTLGKMGKYEESLEYYLKIIENDEYKNDANINYQIGWLYSDLEKAEEALKYFFKAEKLGRDDRGINAEIGINIAKTGNILEGIDRLKRALTMEDNITVNDKIFLNSEIAFWYGELRDVDNALEYLYKAEELGRNDIWINSQIGWNLLEKDLHKALEYFDKIKSLGKDDAWLNMQYGFAYSRLGEYENAISYFKKARGFGEDNSWLLYQLGLALKETGNIEEAINVFKEEIEITDYQGFGDLQLAWCYALIDEKEKAKEYFKNVDKYLSSSLENDEKLKKDYNTVNELINSDIYFN